MGEAPGCSCIDAEIAVSNEAFSMICRGGALGSGALGLAEGLYSSVAELIGVMGSGGIEDELLDDDALLLENIDENLLLNAENIELLDDELLDDELALKFDGSIFLASSIAFSATVVFFASGGVMSSVLNSSFLIVTDVCIALQTKLSGIALFPRKFCRKMLFKTPCLAMISL